jgi:hypothetical protein
VAGDFNNDGQTDLAVLVANADNPFLLMQQGNMSLMPAVTFSPTHLSFASQVVFTASPPQTVVLTNSGLGVLKISGGALTHQFTGTTNCPETILPGASCNITVRFKPTKKGILPGAISVNDNAPGSPQKVSLSGTGTVLQINPISVNFGNQPVNTMSPPKYITLLNKGDAAVNFYGSGVSIMGGDELEFAEQNNCTPSLASGASCRIKITFTPAAQGAQQAYVSLTDDGGGSPQIVPLMGTGTP